MADLLAQLVGDCRLIDQHRPFAGRCGAYFADLEWPPRPPDLPSEGQRRMRVVKGGKK
jgi:hypothetical protein